MKSYKKLVETIANTQCVSYMLTGNVRYEKDEQRCGCVVHMARQMLADAEVSDNSIDDGSAT